MITLQDTILSAIVKLAAGNPGALSVLADIVKADEVTGFITLCDIDDMGMTGPAIWIGYKDFAKQDLGVFVKACRERSPEMVEMIRKEGYLAGVNRCEQR